MKTDNLQSAAKRAQHFGVVFDGPFSVTGNTGASIAARNYCWLIDAAQRGLSKRNPQRSVVKCLTQDLIIMDSWARAINDYCDKNRIAGDTIARWAFSSFLSRLWWRP